MVFTKNIKNIAFSLAFLSFPLTGNCEDSFLTKNMPFPGDFAASTTFISDYTFRGVSQTMEAPAIQGSIDYSVELPFYTNLYLGIWGSNVDFGASGDATAEFDYVGGLKYKYAGASLDLGFIYYDYPGAKRSMKYNFLEGKVALGYDFDVVAFTASVNHTGQNFGNSGNATYYALGATVPLPGDFILDGHIGRQEVEKNAVFLLPDYTEWAVGLATNYEGLDFKVQYIDTNISKVSCADGCDAKAVFSVSKVF